MGTLGGTMILVFLFFHQNHEILQSLKKVTEKLQHPFQCQSFTNAMHVFHTKFGRWQKVNHCVTVH